MLTAFEGDAHAARREFDVLDRALSEGTKVTTKVGYKGASRPSEVVWHAKVGMWSLLVPDYTKNRFWCCFGIEDPRDKTDLNITVEINPAHEGTNFRVAGAFANDARGDTHLCHNGGIGGSKPGVGKTAFCRHYLGDLTPMMYQGRTEQVVDLGPTVSRDLPRRIARFAREVARIKKAIEKEGEEASNAVHSQSERRRPTNRNPSYDFTPEFSGTRRSYTLRRIIESSADHGLVVDALKETVERIGHVALNDGTRDLFVTGDDRRVEFLLEVKTDTTTQPIYTAVGQLLLNGRARDEATRMILVVPDTPKPKTRDALRSIGIDVLDYKWRKGAPAISSSKLRRLMQRLDPLA